jgi:hypothetical protein
VPWLLNALSRERRIRRSAIVAGLLTDNEFDVKKAELLKRI